MTTSENSLPIIDLTDTKDPLWSVGEHTDYGLVTILLQDESGGLQIRSRAPSASGLPSEWVPAPPVEGSFVCNIGDMLDRMTGGLYRSTPHRARNAGTRSRLSFPFFFDPNWETQVHPIVSAESVVDDKNERWDRASVHTFQGTYGDYLLVKISSVFPELRRDVI